MSRALRIEFPGAIYHAMARGVARMPVFLDDSDRFALLGKIEGKVRLGVLIVHAICMMLNHIHLLCETPCAGMGRIMHDILGNHASDFNRAHHRVGHLWQGRYKAILVQDGTYLLRCSRYIHLNPLKAGLLTAGFCYPWSSYQRYMGERSFFPWVCTDRILSFFNSRYDYQAFLEAGVDEFANPFELAAAGIAYGDPGFVRRICRLARQTGTSDDQPAIRLLRKIVASPTIETVHSAIESCFADSSPCQKRRHLVWALHSYAWLKNQDIARSVGLKRSAVSEIIRSVEKNSLTDHKIAGRLLAVANLIQRSAALGLPSGPIAQASSEV